MKRTIFLYGLVLAVLVFVLKYMEYSLLLHNLSIEFYIGLIALGFTVLGIWVGFRLTSRKVITVYKSAAFVLNEPELQRLGISKREHEVLELMALGLTNQQIADRLFVSLNTIKTHSSNLFLKLEVNRRTQAIQRGKELRLIP